MKALAYIGQSTVRRIEAPEPDVIQGHVIVNVICAGICGTDIGAVKNGRPPLPERMILGHEFVGRRADDGKLVVANPIISCGRCAACERGETNLCESRKVIGVHCAGAFAERVLVPESNLLEWAGDDFARAALVEPIATALHAWRRSPQPRKGVAILGAGAIGMSVLAVLKAEGVQDVAISDVSQSRLDCARRCGADRTHIESSESFEVVIDTVGALSTRERAVTAVRPGGTAVLVGLHDAMLSVPGGPIVAGERNIRGSFAYTHGEFRDATGIAATADTRWVKSVSFDEGEEVFAGLLTGRDEQSHAKIQIRIG